MTIDRGTAPRTTTGRAPTGRPLARRGRARSPRRSPRAPPRTTRAARSSTRLRPLRRRGFMSMLVPSELGGGGATHARGLRRAGELAHGCPSTSLALSMHTHLVAAQVWRHQRGLPAPVLAKVADGSWCSSPPAPPTGSSRTARPRRSTAATACPARKTPASGAPAGDILVTSFRWDGRARRPAGHPRGRAVRAARA